MFGRLRITVDLEGIFQTVIAVQVLLGDLFAGPMFPSLFISRSLCFTGNPFSSGRFDKSNHSWFWQSVHRIIGKRLGISFFDRVWCMLFWWTCQGWRLSYRSIQHPPKPSGSSRKTPFLVGLSTFTEELWICAVYFDCTVGCHPE